MPKETKHERFLRVAATRTNKVLDAMSVLEKCSARSTYEYTPQEAKKMIGAIKKKLHELEASFSSGADNNREAFTF